MEVWSVAEAGTDGNGRRMLRTQQIAQILSATFHRLCAIESVRVSSPVADDPCCIAAIALQKRPLDRSSIARDIRGGVRHPHQVILAPSPLLPACYSGLLRFATLDPTGNSFALRRFCAGFFISCFCAPPVSAPVSALRFTLPHTHRGL